jgi:hypothetical protein
MAVSSCVVLYLILLPAAAALLTMGIVELTATNTRTPALGGGPLAAAPAGALSSSSFWLSYRAQGSTRVCLVAQPPDAAWAGDPATTAAVTSVCYAAFAPNACSLQCDGSLAEGAACFSVGLLLFVACIVQTLVGACHVGYVGGAPPARHPAASHSGAAPGDDGGAAASPGAAAASGASVTVVVEQPKGGDYAVGVLQEAEEAKEAGDEEDAGEAGEEERAEEEEGEGDDAAVIVNVVGLAAHTATSAGRDPPAPPVATFAVPLVRSASLSSSSSVFSEWSSPPLSNSIFPASSLSSPASSARDSSERMPPGPPPLPHVALLVA